MNELKVIGKQKIGSIEFTGIEGGFGEGKKAMLVKDIADIHQTEVRRINEVINRNRDRFKNDKDIIDLKSAIVQNDNEINHFGFTQNSFNASKNIYLLSERGYAKLLKILEDDKAWEIYDELVDNYFNMRQTINDNQIAIPQTPMQALELMFQVQHQTESRVENVEKEVEYLKSDAVIPIGDYNLIASRINKRVSEVCAAYGITHQKGRSKLFSDINGGIKAITGVGHRSQLRKKHYELVMDFINNWEPSSATRVIINQLSFDV